MVRKGAFIIGMLWLLQLFTTEINATLLVNKEKVPYEITRMTMESNQLHIEGWGFAITDQHFLNASTHAYFIELSSPSETKIYSTTLRNMTQTSLVEYRGAPTCELNEYNKEQYECNYRYEMVGFKATINLSELLLGEKYMTSLVVETKQTNKRYKIPMYVPMNQPVMAKIGDIQYQATSSLKDTQIKVTYSTVVARNGPSTAYPHASGGAVCSSTYGNKLYYKQFAVFKTLIDRHFDGITTYYHVEGQPDSCVNSRRTVVEGKTVKPLWIASVFVDYSGTPLTIQSRLINSPPILTIEHPTYTVGDVVLIKNHVSAWDAEEGNLSEQIHILNESAFDAPGVYAVALRVQDKYNEVTTGIMYVTMIAPSNTPPNLMLFPPTITQYSAYNYKEHVFAYDLEDGNISHLINPLNHVTTDLPGVVNQCFTVSDSHGATSTGCMDVTITPYHVSNPVNYRFISFDARHSAGYPWFSYQYDLINQLQSKYAILKKRFD